MFAAGLKMSSDDNCNLSKMGDITESQTRQCECDPEAQSSGTKNETVSNFFVHFPNDTSKSGDDTQEWVDERIPDYEKVPTQQEEPVMSEKKEIDYLHSLVRERIEFKIQQALKWARKYEKNIGSEYKSTQIAAIVFLYESAECEFSSEVGEMLCILDTAEINALLSWLRETFIFDKTVVYDAFESWKENGSNLGFQMAYSLNETYEIIHEAACRRDILLIKWLLKRSVEVDTRDCSGNTALHIASKEGYEDVVRFLLNNGASIFVVNSELHSPFDLAYNSENFDVCNILQRTHIGNKITETMFLEVVEEGNLRKLVYLLKNNRWNCIWSALLKAVDNGHTQVLEILLHHCPLLRDAPSDLNEIVLNRAFLKGDHNIIETLLAAGFQMEDSVINFAERKNRNELLNRFRPQPLLDIVD